MARWEPNARSRLEHAARDLFGERGFDNTTVAEIAQRAGLTERTFFRHFADKREVLFSGTAVLTETLVTTVREAPAELAPIELVALALDRIANTAFVERHAFAKARQVIINAHPDLRERELVKLTMLAAALADALRARGVPDMAAQLASEAGIAVFRIAFESWVAGTEEWTLAQRIQDCLAELKLVTGGALTNSG